MEENSKINTVNGLVFKDDLLLMDKNNIPTNDISQGHYVDFMYVRATEWYKENINLYENSFQRAKYVNGIFKESFMDVYSEGGVPTGDVKSYDEIHQKGLWHKGVHLWIINSRGDILLHRRSQKVQTRPGLWENSAGGHIDAGYTSLQTAERELHEELGILMSPNKFELIGTIVDQFITNGGACINNEWDDFYLIDIGDVEITINKEENEIAETKWINFKDLEEKIKNHDPLYMPRQAEYDILFPLLHKRYGNVLD
jgi:isopentenyldiphosphate isomerase